MERPQLGEISSYPRGFESEYKEFAKNIQEIVLKELISGHLDPKLTLQKLKDLSLDLTNGITNPRLSFGGEFYGDGKNILDNSRLLGLAFQDPNILEVVKTAQGNIKGKFDNITNANLGDDKIITQQISSLEFIVRKLIDLIENFLEIREKILNSLKNEITEIFNKETPNFNFTDGFVYSKQKDLEIKMKIKVELSHIFYNNYYDAYFETHYNALLITCQNNHDIIVATGLISSTIVLAAAYIAKADLDDSYTLATTVSALIVFLISNLSPKFYNKYNSIFVDELIKKCEKSFGIDGDVLKQETQHLIK